jgi:hypothetical protein
VLPALPTRGASVSNRVSASARRRPDHCNYNLASCTLTASVAGAVTALVVHDPCPPKPSARPFKPLVCALLSSSQIPLLSARRVGITKHETHPSAQACTARATKGPYKGTAAFDRPTAIAVRCSTAVRPQPRFKLHNH